LDTPTPGEIDVVLMKLAKQLAKSGKPTRVPRSKVSARHLVEPRGNQRGARTFLFLTTTGSFQ
jgi:hypothetical protein